MSAINTPYKCSAIKQFADTINVFLEKCAFQYKIECMKVNRKDDIKQMIEMSKCHSQAESDVIEPDTSADIINVLAIHKQTGKVASFLSWENYKNKKVKLIYIMWSCTKIDDRRKGLSTLLRMVPIMYGIHHKFDYVVADTNEQSSPLLVNKFGFEYQETYDAKIGNMTNWDISINTKLKLEEPYLKTFKATLEKWKQCALRKKLSNSLQSEM